MEEFFIVVLTLSIDSFISWYIGRRPMIFLNMCINLDVNPINSQLNFLGYLTPPCDLKELLYLGDVMPIVAVLQ